MSKLPIIESEILNYNPLSLVNSITAAPPESHLEPESEISVRYVKDLLKQSDFLSDLFSFPEHGQEGLKVLDSILTEYITDLLTTLEFSSLADMARQKDGLFIKQHATGVLKQHDFLTYLFELPSRGQEGVKLFNDILAKYMSDLLKDSLILIHLFRLPDREQEGIKLFNDVLTKYMPDLLKEWLFFVCLFQLYDRGQGGVKLFNDVLTKYMIDFLKDKHSSSCLFELPNGGEKVIKPFNDVLSKFLQESTISERDSIALKHLVCYIAMKPDNYKSLEPVMRGFLEKHSKIVDKLDWSEKAEDYIQKLSYKGSLIPLIDDLSMQVEDPIINKLLEKSYTDVSGTEARSLLVKKLAKGISLVMEDSIICKVLERMASPLTKVSINLFEGGPLPNKFVNGSFVPTACKVKIYNTKQKLIESADKSLEYIKIMNTFVHEGTHAVLYSFYNNESLPFAKNDISSSKKIDGIISEIVPLYKAKQEKGEDARLIAFYTLNQCPVEIPAFFTSARSGGKLVQKLQVNIEIGDSILLENSLLNRYMEKIAKDFSIEEVLYFASTDQPSYSLNVISSIISDYADEVEIGISGGIES